MSSNPSLSLDPWLGTLSCSLMPHIHLTTLISACRSATSFFILTGQFSLPCNVLLCKQLLYSLLIGKQWYQLPDFISIQFEFWSPQLHRHLCLHSTCHLNNKTYPLTPDLHWHQYLHLCSCTDCFIHTTSTNKRLHHLYMLPLQHFISCVPTSVRWYTALNYYQHLYQRHHLAFCITFCLSPLIIALVLFIFTLMPLFSTKSLCSLSL